MSTDSPAWGECIYDHFERHLGKPLGRDRFELDSSQPLIQIIQYNNVFGGCRAFCSFGLSHYASQLGTVGEVFLPVDEGWESTPQILASVLFTLVKKRAPLARGQAIEFAEVFPEFVVRFHKSALYFADPYGVPDDFATVRCDSAMGEIFLGSYISDAEFQFLKTTNTDTFEEYLQSRNVDMFQLSRPSSI